MGGKQEENKCKKAEQGEREGGFTLPFLEFVSILLF